MEALEEDTDTSKYTQVYCKVRILKTANKSYAALENGSMKEDWKTRVQEASEDVTPHLRHGNVRT